MKEFNEEEFLKTYRGTDKFITEARGLYNLFLRLLENKDLLDKIKFANDYLGEAPLKAFIYYCRAEKKTELFDRELKVFEKQGIGSCFGYLYRFMYDEKYVTRQCLVNDRLTGIKTISRFEKS